MSPSTAVVTHDIYRPTWRVPVAVGATILFMGSGVFSRSVFLGILPIFLGLALLFFLSTRAVDRRLRKKGTLRVGADGFRAPWARPGEEFRAWPTVSSIERMKFKGDVTAKVRVETTKGPFVFDAHTMAAAEALEESLRTRLAEDRARVRLSADEFPRALLKGGDEGAQRSQMLPSSVLARIAEDVSHEPQVRVRAARMAAGSGDPLVVEALRASSADDEVLEALSE